MLPVHRIFATALERIICTQSYDMFSCSERYTQLPLIRDSVDLRLVCPKIS